MLKKSNLKLKTNDTHTQNNNNLKRIDNKIQIQIQEL